MDPKTNQPQSNQKVSPQKIVQQAAKSTTQYNPQPKSKKKMIIIAIALILAAFFVLTIILLILSRGSGSNNESVGDQNSENVNQNTNPVKAVFLRDGNIWIKDLEQDAESELIETSDQRVNRLLFSNDGEYVGVILFNESLFVAQQNDYGQVFLHDLSKNENINIGAVEFDSANVNEDKYFFTDSCDYIEEKYSSFCWDYADYLKDSNDGRIKPYNISTYGDSKYMDEDFKLIRSKVLSNGLVLAEYENSDEKSYTILVNEKDEKIVLRIDDAKGISFIFN